MATLDNPDAKKIRVTYTKSGIGYKKDQKQTIAALGLKKLGQTVVHTDSPSIRGMIAKVIHLVTVEENK